MSRRILGLAALGMLCVGVVRVDADPKSNATTKASRTSALDDMGELTPGREAAALVFAEEHHPELAALLRRLKKQNRRHYDRAVKTLFLAEERLAKLKSRDSQRYALSVRSWEIESRIRLLAVRASLSDDPALETALQKLVRERVDVRLKLLRIEQVLAQQRLNRVDQSIQQIVSDRAAADQKELARLKKSLGIYKAGARSGKGKPAPTGNSGKRTKKPSADKTRKPAKSRTR